MHAFSVEYESKCTGLLSSVALGVPVMKRINIVWIFSILETK